MPAMSSGSPDADVVMRFAISGMSVVPDAPNLAGQTAAYVAAQLQAFKSGARKNEAMSLVASTLSDPDIDNLAAYYSAIEIRIGTIPGQ